MELDVRGEMCPYPAMKAHAALKKLTGDRLVVLTDHAPALSTVPWEGAKEGFDAEIEEVGAGEWRIALTRHGGEFDRAAALERISSQLRKIGPA